MIRCPLERLSVITFQGANGVRRYREPYPHNIVRISGSRSVRSALPRNPDQKWRNSGTGISSRRCRFDYLGFFEDFLGVKDRRLRFAGA